MHCDRLSLWGRGGGGGGRGLFSGGPIFCFGIGEGGGVIIAILR